MNILVVYDSMYGNTEKVAQAIGTAIGATVLHVNQVKEEQLAGLDILIVGSPTQAFQPPLKSMKTFLKDLPSGILKGVKIASFDTRSDVEEVGSKVLSFLVKLFGYAAEPMQAKLVRKGGVKVITPPAGFFSYMVRKALLMKVRSSAPSNGPSRCFHEQSGGVLWEWIALYSNRKGGAKAIGGVRGGADLRPQAATAGHGQDVLLSLPRLHHLQCPSSPSATE